MKNLVAYKKCVPRVIFGKCEEVRGEVLWIKDENWINRLWNWEVDFKSRDTRGQGAIEINFCEPENLMKISL